MGHAVSIILAGMALSGCAAVQTESQVQVRSSSLPTMTAVQPVNPVSSKPGGPIIQSITAQIPNRGAVAENVLIPEFHFVAPNGNAVLVHREIVKSSSQTNNVNFNPSAAINIPAEAQKRGAVFSGGWGCGTDQYFTTVRVFIMDSDGNRSNEVQYTVHCNGG